MSPYAQIERKSWKTPPVFRGVKAAYVLLFTLCVLFLSAADSRAANACSVTRKDDKELSVAEFTFTGSVAAGSDYGCEFVPGIFFQLEPEGDGWRVVVHGENAGENLATASAGPNGLHAPFISGADIPQSGWKPQDMERRFFLSQARKSPAGDAADAPAGKENSKRGGGGHGSLRITGITWEGQHKMAAMSFEPTIQLDVLVADGVSYYKLVHDFKLPKTISAPPPKYTPEATKARLEGVVALRCTVDAQGNARDITVVQSLGMGLDQSAIDVLKNSKFEPATIDGHPVTQQLKMKITFHLPEWESGKYK